MVSPVRALAATLLVLGVAGVLGTGVVAGVADTSGSVHEADDRTHQIAGPTPHHLAAGGTARVGASTQDFASTNRTTWNVDVQATGDARWTIVTRFNITSDTDEAAFEELGASFLDGDEPQLGLPEFRTVVERVDDETERDMALVGDERRWSVEGEGVNRTGRLELRFTWQNFALVDEDGIHIDEAVLTVDGAIWFRGLSAGQKLVISLPDGYGVDDANVAPKEGALRWTGPTNFESGTLEATFVGIPGNGTGNGDNGTDQPNGPDDNDASMLPLLGAFAILVLAVAVVIATQRDELRQRLGTGTAADSEQVTDHGAESADAEGDSRASPTPETTAEGDTSGEAGEAVDLDLLSDEERIEHLLESNGGRMKQASIVNETDWSNAKVSQLLSSMEEDGQIDKLRIGRENLISFPDQDITDIENE